MSANAKSKEYRELVSISQALQHEYRDENKMWNGSPFEWIKYRPSRSIGAIGEKIVSSWLALHDFNVSRSPDTEADRLVEGKRVEIKFSTLWKNGTYLFEQIRDQNYDFAIFLGVSPADAHCWVVPKNAIIRMWKEEHRMTPQHGGAKGNDTTWARLSPSCKEAADDVLFQSFGNDLHESLASIGRLTGYSPMSFSAVFDLP
ncbi:MAG: hypothetical protein IJ829_01460 [Kiritimatiellae bacterium]|nr:hypothetical protein [Kiritimatiellia bacterium]